MDTRTVEEFIEEQLKKRIENFNMKDFLKGKRKKRILSKPFTIIWRSESMPGTHLSVKILPGNPFQRERLSTVDLHIEIAKKDVVSV